MVGGQSFVATHSPSILDNIPAGAILKLSLSAVPNFVSTEEGRLALYRQAGFRASALTQADVLIVTEGDSDGGILQRCIPELSAAASHSPGGRTLVIRSIQALRGFDVPLLGVVDADLAANPIPSDVLDICHQWPQADIEGVLLADENFLRAAIDGSLLMPEYTTVETVRKLLQELMGEFKEATIAELAARKLRLAVSIEWPSPRGQDPLGALRSSASSTRSLDALEIDEAIAGATLSWEEAGELPWTLVRGKWIVQKFAQRATNFKSGAAFISAVIARKPEVVEFSRLAVKVRSVLNPPKPT